MATVPLPYIGTGPGNTQQVLGHYSVAQVSGATVSLGANAFIASLRWAPTNPQTYLVLQRCLVGWAVSGAVTAATIMDASLRVVRGFTTDFTTAATGVVLTGVTATNQMRKTMNPSQAAAKICTTTTMSGQSLVSDVAPFRNTVWANHPSGNATVTQAVGVGGQTQTLYEWTALGAHPVVLSNFEGLVVQNPTAAVVSGTIQYYVTWEWAEVFVF
jgi:hypothetical protein